MPSDEASVSPNTRRAYAGALRRRDVWLDGRELHDVTLAAYLAELHDAGRAASSASMAVAAACFRAKLAGQSTPAGERTARVLAGYRRTAGDRGRGQARPFGVSDLAAVLTTCHRPRRRGRGVESDQIALERGRLDAVIAGLLFMAGMRRSEVSALRWADVVESTDADGMLVTVRRSKTNQEGETNDVRFVKDGVARALRTLRGTTSPEPGERVVPLFSADDRVAVHDRGAGRRRRVPSDRALGTGRLGERVDEPGRIDHRRDARRKLEDQPHGGALLRRGDRGTRRCCTLPVAAYKGPARGWDLPTPPTPHGRSAAKPVAGRGAAGRKKSRRHPARTCCTPVAFIASQPRTAAAHWTNGRTTGHTGHLHPATSGRAADAVVPLVGDHLSGLTVTSAIVAPTAGLTHHTRLLPRQQGH